MRSRHGFSHLGKVVGSGAERALRRTWLGWSQGYTSQCSVVETLVAGEWWRDRKGTLRGYSLGPLALDVGRGSLGDEKIAGKKHRL